MHGKRWITGLVGFPLLVLLIFKGDLFLFGTVLAAVCLISLWEYFRIVSKPLNMPAINRFSAVVLLFSPFVLLGGAIREPDLSLACAGLCLIFLGSLVVSDFSKGISSFSPAAAAFWGLVYVCFGLLFLVIVRGDQSGARWIFWVLCIVFSGDVGAYYAGSYLGHHKLMPAVSPKKTVEGAMGGILANILLGSLLKLLLFPELNWPLSILFFICVGVSGQIGDMFESVLKRSAEIKDSGWLLPGHGGFLDRIDALLFAAPVVLFFRRVVF